jgi:hypothetical protein
MRERKDFQEIGFESQRPWGDSDHLDAIDHKKGTAAEGNIGVPGVAESAGRPPQPETVLKPNLPSAPAADFLEQLGQKHSSQVAVSPLPIRASWGAAEARHKLFHLT